MDNIGENYKLDSNRWINTLPNTNGDNSLNPNKWINTLPKKNESNSFKKYSVITILFIVGLIFVSIVKNETRNIQKEINNLKASILDLKLEFHQTSLDHEVITSPENITLLAKEHLEINLFPYKKSQIRHLYQKTEISKKIEEKKYKKISKKLPEEIRIKIAKKIVLKKNELKKIKEIYDEPKNLPIEIKTRVAKKIKKTKKDLKSLYSSPKDAVEKAQRWVALQVIKSFFGMPVIPGK